MNALADAPGRTESPLRIETSRFGALEVPPERLYDFPEGLLGFERVAQFALLEHPGGGGIEWLQAVSRPSLAFVVTDPRPYFPDYRVPVRREDLAGIGLEDPAEGVVRVILWVPDDPLQATANLQGPVLLNPRTRRGRQLVLDEGPYTTRHRLFATG